MNSFAMRPSIPTAGLLALFTLPSPALAGTLSGTASYRERIALPPDAVFEAVLIDIARADAPAPVLGRAKLQPAGQPPFRFSIPYRDADLSPRGRYAVRAMVRSGDRLLFTTDTITPVHPGGPSQPLDLRLVKVGGVGTPRPSGSSPRPMSAPPLRGTLWTLQALQDGSGPALSNPPGPPADLQLAADQGRVSGTGGCNRLMGGFRLAGEQISFSRMASTQMACDPAVMAFERRYAEALGRVRRWSIDKQNLLLQDDTGRTLLLFRAGS